jgi:hypothetical protein
VKRPKSHPKSTLPRALRAPVIASGRGTLGRTTIALAIAIILGGSLLVVGLAARPFAAVPDATEAAPIQPSAPDQPQASGFALPSVGPGVDPIPNPTSAGVPYPTAPTVAQPTVAMPGAPSLGLDIP